MYRMAWVWYNFPKQKLLWQLSEVKYMALLNGKHNQCNVHVGTEGIKECLMVDHQV